MVASTGAAAGPGGHGDAEADADAATAAAWVSSRGECFVTGHASGAVRVWGMPAGSAGELAAAPAAAEALVTLWVAAEGVQRAPVQQLTWVGPAREAGCSSLLVRGGQLPDQPGLLSLLPLLPAELVRPHAALPRTACALASARGALVTWWARGVSV